MGKSSKAKKTAPKLLATPNKSPADPLEYRALQLYNGLKVLLISDPTADMGLSDEDEEDYSEDEEMSEEEDEMSENEDGEHADDDIGLRNAAAALCVNSGSFHEPKDAPGLAHFLEHMVFMGSKKYPDENKFDEFLSARNGWSNAYTDAENTLYYFEVKPSSLEEALDMWSRFYIDPLLKEDSVNREVQAVDSEFQIAQTKDSNRLSAVMMHLADESHPANKFGWGNILSLKGTKDTESPAPHLYKNLLELHQKYYAAKTMTLAVQSPHDLDELQKFVVKQFGAIPNQATHVNPHSTIAEHVNKEVWADSYGKLLEVRPVGDKIKLVLQWQLKALIDDWESDPVHYISWLTGHEGKGSIYDYLSRNGLATELSSGTGGYGDDTNRLYTLYKFEITLTEKGYDNIQQVLNAVHSYLSMMRSSGAVESIWKMVAKIDSINWKTKELEEPNENVVSCTEQMMKYPVEHWLDAEDILHKYNPELIQELLSVMTPERTVMTILNPKFREEEEESAFPETDDWFGVKWRKAENFDYKFQQIEKEELYYPSENPYLTDDLDLVVVPEEKTELPEIIEEDEKSRLFFQPDFEFNLPKSFIKVIYRCDDFLHEGNHTRMALMYILPTFMTLDLSAELYDATTASLSYTVNIKNSGFTLETRGISATNPTLLKRLVRWLAEPETWKKESFDMAKNEVQTELQNKLLDSGKVGAEVRVRFLESGSVTTPQILQAFGSCDFDKIKSVVADMLKASSLDMLYQGNAKREQASELFNSILKLLPIGGKIDQNAGIKVRKLEKNETMLVNSFNTRTSDNHYVTKYYQYKPCSARESCLVELFTDIISESTFNELRTKRQLGYVAYSSIKNSWGTIGWSVDVKSSVENHKMEYIQECIDEYTDQFIPNEVLAKLDNNMFKTYVSSMIVAKTAKDDQLKNAAKRNYGEIESQDFMFNRLEKEVEWLEKLKLDEFMDFTNQMLSECRVMKVQIHGNSVGNEANLTEFDFLESSSIQSTNPDRFALYPVSQNI